MRLAGSQAHKHTRDLITWGRFWHPGQYTGIRICRAKRVELSLCFGVPVNTRVR